MARLRPSARVRDAREIPGHPGYRATSTGVIQSRHHPGESSPGDDWRDLSTQLDAYGRLTVQLGSTSGGTRTRRSLRQLLIAAWGEDRGQAIFDRVRRRRVCARRASLVKSNPTK